MSTYPDFEKFNLMKQEQTIASDSTSPQLLSKEEQTEGETKLCWIKRHAEAIDEIGRLRTLSRIYDEHADELASSLSRVEGERDELKRENQEMREVLGEWYMREFAGNARTLPMAIKGRSVGYDPFEERIVALIEGRGVGRVQELKKLLRKALNCIGDGFPVVDEIRKALN